MSRRDLLRATFPLNNFFFLFIFIYHSLEVIERELIKGAREITPNRIHYKPEMPIIYENTIFI